MSGFPFKLGRNRPNPARLERQPTFRAYRTAAPIVVPDAWDYGALCTAALQTMLANGPDPTAPPQIAATGVGDCTCAAIGHATDIWTAGGGAPVTITADQTVTLYELACNYQLGNEATDQGGDELSVLDYVAANGIDGNGLHRIAGTASLDATNLTEMREGLFLTGALPLCLELPNEYVNPFPGPDAVWDVAGAPNPQQGHCVLGVSYTTNCPNGKPAWGLVTWGTIIWFTTDACAEYCATSNGGSANLGLSKEWLSATKGVAPNALNYAALAADFQQLGGIVS